MAYLAIGNEVDIDFDLGDANDRSLAKVRGAVMKQTRLIFDN